MMVYIQKPSSTMKLKKEKMVSSSSSSLSLKDIYLILYNGVCCIGWSMVLGLALKSILLHEKDDDDDDDMISMIRTRLSNVYIRSEEMQLYLIISQCAAIMEIIHSMIRIVRSPVIVTTMQVSSRLIALYALVQSPTGAQIHWSHGVMIFSWSIVEIPRYAFYMSAIITGGDATKKTPFVLFWLRYSLFAILYPTGIMGELYVFHTAANDKNSSSIIGNTPLVQFIYGTLLPIIYFFGSPLMILNMMSNRRSAFRKRYSKPIPPLRGLCWPITNKVSGQRSTTDINKSIVAAAIQAANTKEATNIAEEVMKCKDWRFQYPKYYIDGLLKQQIHSPEVAIQMAKAGLEKAYELFEFIHEDGTITSFQEAMKLQPPHDDDTMNKDTTTTTKKKPFFYTGYIKAGTSGTTTTTSSSKKRFEVPYKGKTLYGDELRKQVLEWVQYGTIEQSAADGIIACIDHPEYYDETSLKDKYFVLLGAGSAMGPFTVLLSLGANIIAIDLDRPHIWKRLLTMVQESNNGGSITFPMRTKQDQCISDEEIYNVSGCNLFTHTPYIRDWLLYDETINNNNDSRKDMIIGNYAYLDGALHVQVSLAMDAICRDITYHRCTTKKRNTTTNNKTSTTTNNNNCGGGGVAALAYLCTPTDLHLIPEDAYNEQIQLYHNDYSKRIYCMALSALSWGKLLHPNANEPIKTSDGTLLHYVNGISTPQGPNYILAKRMQHWRAIIAHNGAHCDNDLDNNNNNGSAAAAAADSSSSSSCCIVSSNVAPSTSTKSVVHNRTFAWAYEGMPYFKPYEIFEPATSNAVMTALLLYDIHDPNSIANATTTNNNNNNNNKDNNNNTKKSAVLVNPYQLFTYGSFHGGVWRCAYTINSIGEASVLLYFGRLSIPYIRSIVIWSVIIMGGGTLFIRFVEDMLRDMADDED